MRNLALESSSAWASKFKIKQQILAGTSERTVDLKSLNARKKRLEGLSVRQQGIYGFEHVPKDAAADSGGDAG